MWHFALRLNLNSIIHTVYFRVQQVVPSLLNIHVIGFQFN